MLILHLLYTGAALLVGIVSMLTTTGLVPHQVRRMLNASFFRSLGGSNGLEDVPDIVIHTPPQAHIDTVGSTVLSPLATVLADAHTLDIQPPVVVSSSPAAGLRDPAPRTSSVAVLTNPSSEHGDDVGPYASFASLVPSGGLVVTAPKGHLSSSASPTVVPSSPATASALSTSGIHAACAIALLALLVVAVISIPPAPRVEHPTHVVFSTPVDDGSVSALPVVSSFIHRVASLRVMSLP